MSNYANTNDVALFLNFNNAGTDDVPGSGFVGGFPNDGGFRTYPSSGQVARRLDMVEKWIDTQARTNWRPAGVQVQNEYHGWCLTRNAKVLTVERGLIPINEVHEGETAISYDNKGNVIFGKIKKLYKNGIKPVYKITLHSRSIEATENHKFLIIKKTPIQKSRWGNFAHSRHLEWVPVSEIKPDDIILILKERPFEGKKFQFNFNIEILPHATTTKIPTIPKETNKELMWLFGMFLGDGSFHNGIQIAEFDSLKKEKIQKIVKTNFNLDTAESRNAQVKIGNGLDIILRSRIIERFFKSIGLDGDCYTKQVPQFISTLPKEEILSFIEGFVDSDGSRQNDSHSGKEFWRIYSCNKKIIEDMKQLCNLIGIRNGKIFEYKRTSTNFDNARNKYELQIYPNGIKHCRISNGEMGLVDKISIKRFRENKLNFEKIKNIENIGEQEVFDIEIDHDSHNFVANGIIVSNSFWRFKEIRTRAFNDEGSIFLKNFPILALDSTLGDKIEVFTGTSTNDGYEDYLLTKTQGRTQDFWVDTNYGRISFANSRPYKLRDAVRVTYRHGDTSGVPQDIKYATILLTAAQIVQTEDFSQIFPEGSQNLNYRDKVDQWKKEAEEIIDFHRRLVVESTEV